MTSSPVAAPAASRNGRATIPMLADHHHLPAAHVHRPPDDRQRPVGDLGQLLDAGALLHEHHELVAAHPGHGVPCRAELGVEAVRDGAQELVARVVAEGVVDGLEAVEVEVADPDRGGGAVRPGERGLEPGEEQRAVRQPGERVVLGLVTQP